MGGELLFLFRDLMPSAADSKQQERKGEEEARGYLRHPAEASA